MFKFRSVYYVAFWAILIGVVVFSCTQQHKQLGPNGSESVQNQAEGVEYLASAASFQNPYDSIGQYHNQILQAFIDQYEVDEISADLCVSVVDSFMEEIGWDFLTVEQVQQLNDLAVFFENHTAEQIDSINLALIEAEGYSQAFRNYYQAVGDAFLEMEEDLIISALLDTEQEIFNDEGLSEEERNILLMNTSVARYSTVYWAAVSNDPDSPWTNGSAGKVTFSWYNVGEADADGIITGAVGGLLLTKTVQGAIVGGLAGGALGSLWGAAKQFL